MCKICCGTRLIGIVRAPPLPSIQIYETQLNELSTQAQALSADVVAKEGLLQEARDIINSKVSWL